MRTITIEEKEEVKNMLSDYLYSRGVLCRKDSNAFGHQLSKKLESEIEFFVMVRRTLSPKNKVK